LYKVTEWPDDLADSYGAAARDVMSKVARVPDIYRDFAVTEAEAVRVQGIKSELLRYLLDLGLPHRGSAHERRFDRLDLDNIALELHLPCPRWVAMRGWSRVLPRQVIPRRVEWTLKLKAHCPMSTQKHACEVVYYPGAVTAREPKLVRAHGSGEYRIDLATRWVSHCFSEQFNVLIERILPLEFHFLPEPLTREEGFAAETGLADCYLATRLLVSAGIDCGLPVRPVSGIFLAKPFATRHRWVEFQDGGTWLAADPFLLNAFNRWGLSDPSEWPANRSPSGVLWPLREPSSQLASHDGAPTKVIMFLSSPSTTGTE
jgi:hypothetical protein